jgi:hypothetical protein
MGKEFNVMLHERRNVFASISQGRECDRKYVQAIVQIAAKFSAPHHSLEVLVSRGYQTHVDAMRAPAPEPFEFLFLQNAEEFGLQRERYVSDFIEEQGSFISQVEAADFLRDRSGKGSPFVAKKLTLEQIERDCGAVELDQRVTAARACIVDRMRDEFLASAGLSLNENSRIRRRNPLGLLQHNSQSRAIAYDLLEPADPTILICRCH